LGKGLKFQLIKTSGGVSGVNGLGGFPGDTGEMGPFGYKGQKGDYGIDGSMGEKGYRVSSDDKRLKEDSFFRICMYFLFFFK
jgi:hypothetical protein